MSESIYFKIVPGLVSVGAVCVVLASSRRLINERSVCSRGGLEAR